MRLTARNESVYLLANTDGSEAEIRIGPEPVEVPDQHAARLLSLHNAISAVPNDRKENIRK